MQNKNLHILVTGESGNGRAYVISKKALRNSITGCLIGALVLSLGSALSVRLFSSNYTLKKEVAALRTDIKTNTELATQLATATSQLEEYQQQISLLRQQQENLVEKSVSRLDERSKIIESVMDSIGVEVIIEEDPKHSGGPFISSGEGSYGEQLLLHTDKYLSILEKTPIGRPLPTKISSRFGRRKDPLNKKSAFHEGLDFKGNTGDKIRATGGGTVKTSTYSRGWGNYIVIDHHNGYKTLFAHLSKRLVKKGENVTRGMVIGHVGNTGRSTGSHLHYEIQLHGKPIDPMKYIKIASLSMKIKN
ncbi:M23 family metallopeptidase [Desulfogranum marinum]|uniref:M23 family metallopeptidase n=1 Tax=Desulfogranum marinum TaxID=453220 RepID=UPI0019626DB9|nr:M23 family metallopeptidase [Desulfogranum marinum]MBM9511407.1 M23 family metallopeptidase [Desulfogranum marinum]